MNFEVGIQTVATENILCTFTAKAKQHLQLPVPLQAESPPTLQKASFSLQKFHTTLAPTIPGFSLREFLDRLENITLYPTGESHQHIVHPEKLKILFKKY